MFGLLNIDKPAGMTSRDVVNRVQRLVKPVKVGHAGTLDPLATGVLLVCLGPATRLVSHLHRFSKTYVAEFLLGCTSATDDTEGELQSLDKAPVLTAAQIEAALPQFRGRTTQIPPAHSAVKIQGRPAYKRARRGEQVDIKPREVDIHRLELVAFATDRMTLEIECSSGTYIRSLGRDLGRTLQSGAVMSALRRTRIGPFDVESAVSYSDLTQDRLGELILPARLAVQDCPAYVVDDDDVQRLRNGRCIVQRDPVVSDAAVALVDRNGELIALAEGVPPAGFAPKLVFVSK